MAPSTFVDQQRPSSGDGLGVDDSELELGDQDAGPDGADLARPDGADLAGPQSGQHPPEVHLLRHTPSLDGLRGAAWSGVFLTHAGLLSFFSTGQTAMFVFFGLSGFLITSLITNEFALRGGVSLRRFFARRAYRLVPALAVFLVIWLAVVAAFGSHPWIRTIPEHHSPGTAEPFNVALEGVGGAIVYLTNWFGIYHVFTGYIPLGHLWSLAVEEQVYVIWAPLCLVLMMWRRRVAIGVALALAVGSLIEVFALVFTHHTGDHLYMGTDTRSGAFLLGGALAMIWAHGGLRAWRRRLPNTAMAALAIALLAAALVWLQPGATPWVYALTWTAATLGGPLLVAALMERGDSLLGRMLSGRVITYLGRRSYALYLWHYVWLTWLRSLGWMGVLLALGLSLASAELSWRLVESRVLARKRRREALPDPEHRRASPHPVALGATG